MSMSRGLTTNIVDEYRDRLEALDPGTRVVMKRLLRTYRFRLVEIREDTKQERGAHE
jgi:hypothetical protein